MLVRRPAQRRQAILRLFREYHPDLMKINSLITLAAALLLSPLSVLTAAESSKTSRPNIIVIMTDDQRWDSLGCYGNKVVKTPNIDALAKEGTRFENAFTVAVLLSSV